MAFILTVLFTTAFFWCCSFCICKIAFIFVLFCLLCVVVVVFVLWPLCLCHSVQSPPFCIPVVAFAFVLFCLHLCYSSCICVVALVFVLFCFCYYCGLCKLSDTTKPPFKSLLSVVV